MKRLFFILVPRQNQYRSILAAATFFVTMPLQAENHLRPSLVDQSQMGSRGQFNRPPIPQRPPSPFNPGQQDPRYGGSQYGTPGYQDPRFGGSEYGEYQDPQFGSPGYQQNPPPIPRPPDQGGQYGQHQPIQIGQGMQGQGSVQANDGSNMRLKTLNGRNPNPFQQLFGGFLKNAWGGAQQTRSDGTQRGNFIGLLLQGAAASAGLHYISERELYSLAVNRSHASARQSNRLSNAGGIVNKVFGRGGI